MPSNIAKPSPGRVYRQKINEIIDGVNNAATLEDVTNEITTTVVPMVEDAIANDETVQTSIATAIATEDIPGQVDTAVDTKVAGLDLFEAQTIVEEEVVFAVVDEDNRRTWIEAAADGGLTTHAVEKIEEHITGAIDQDADLTGLSFAVVDNDGRRTWIEADESGNPTDRSLGLIRDGLSALFISATFSGDSLTRGAGGDGTTTPGVFGELAGITTYNYGTGGEDAVTIAGRAGYCPWLATVDGDEIPTSGGVDVTLDGDDGATVLPLLQGDHGLNPVMIANVEGTLSESSGIYTFTRSTAGDAVTVGRPAPVISLAMRTRMADIWIMEWGQNGGFEDMDTLVRRYWSTIHQITSGRWIVCGPSTGTAASRATVETRLLTEFGFRFFSPRAYLATYAALAERSITPTSQDDTDIAAGTIPESLRSDAVHLNAAGYTGKAEGLYQRTKELRWL
jgi:hypothetical protein